MMEWDSVIGDALRILLEESRSSFREAAHTLPFPRAQGFLVDRDEQTGDIFARAIIADALLDASIHGFNAATSIVDREVDYLIESRQRSGAGGWKYFPQLRELPPDADDLAQVMQLLVRWGRRDAIAEHCERPLEVLLRENRHPDGSFETWIVPGSNRSHDEELQARWIEMAWGSGPDAEVMANLLYALAIYDRERFDDVINAGVAFVEERQQADGSWTSTWYHGPFYGTFVALRLLALCAPQSPAIERAIAFLADAQLEDPLSTALALLALSVTRQHQLRVESTALHEIEAIPFIRMELGRPTGQSWQTLTYSSKTITAAFVLKAALAWKTIDKNLSAVECLPIQSEKQ